jgi:hypothetical protein
MANDSKLKHTVKFVPSGRGKAQCPPDPDFPNGTAILAPPGVAVSCKVDLPYPAPECGWFEVECLKCGFTMVVTAAGRPDDPISVRLPCIITPRVSVDA